MAFNKKTKPHYNPFTPNFGVTPEHQVGHEQLLDELTKGLDRGPRDEGYTPFIVGPRGSGKTIVLSAIEDLAYEQGWIVLSIEASKSNLPYNINEAINQAHKSVGRSAKKTVRTGARVKIGPVQWHREAIQEVATEEGTRTKLRTLAEHAEANGFGVLLTVDEVHSGQRDETKDLMLDIQSITKKSELPLALVAAGLPKAKKTILADDNITFLQRCDRFEMPLLSKQDIHAGLIETIHSANGTISDDALSMLVAACTPLPFHMQLLGSHAWKIAHAPSKQICSEAAMRAIKSSCQDMYERVFLPSWSDLNESEQTYMRVLSKFGGEASQREVHAQTGLPRTTAARTEDNLVNMRYIDSVHNPQCTKIRLTGIMSEKDVTQHTKARGLSLEGLSYGQGWLPLVTRETCAAVMPRAQARCILTKGHQGRHRSR